MMLNRKFQKPSWWPYMLRARIISFRLTQGMFIQSGTCSATRVRTASPIGCQKPAFFAPRPDHRPSIENAKTVSHYRTSALIQRSRLIYYCVSAHEMGRARRKRIRPPVPPHDSLIREEKCAARWTVFRPHTRAHQILASPPTVLVHAGTTVVVYQTR